RGLLTRAVVDGGEIIATLADRIIGRCAAVDVLDPLSGEVVLKAAELIDEDAIDAIERAGIDAVSIRSVLTCEAATGVCGKCYGRDLARGTMVNMGEAVGVIAAQSIGEPGTQLTMRTFHIGGAAQRGAEQSSIEAAFDATIEVKNRNVVINSTGLPVAMGRNCEMVLLDEAGREKARHRVPYGARLLVDEGAQVKRGDRIAEWDPYTIPIITEKDGVAHYVDLIEARKPKDFAIISESEGRVEFGKDYKTKRRIVVVPNEGSGESVEYLIPKGKHISVQEGDYVLKGDLMLDGNRVPHDILRILGVEELASYLINEIQEVYRLQGVRINDKHIEVIVRQMLQKVEIDDPGETTFLAGEQIDRSEFDRENAKVEAEGLRPATTDTAGGGSTPPPLRPDRFILSRPTSGRPLAQSAARRHPPRQRQI